MAETVEDLNQLREMLHHFDTLHIAFQDDDCPYIVPMNFGIGEDQDKIVLYIYTPREGKMTHLIKENHHVGVQAETLYEYFINQIRQSLILIHLLLEKELLNQFLMNYMMKRWNLF